MSETKTDAIKYAADLIPCVVTRAAFHIVSDAMNEQPTFDVGVLRLQPGDKVLVKVSRPLERDEIVMLQTHVQSFVGAAYPVSVIGQEMSIEIVRDEE